MKNAILINDTSNECHIGSMQVIKNISKLCKDNSIDIVARYTRHNIIDNTKGDLKLDIQKSDFIIINGEGSLHHHPRRNTKWFPILMQMIPQNKKICLINALWQDMEELNQYKGCLDKLNFISVRESYSYRNLVAIYPKKDKIIITPDIIFATSFKEDVIGYGDSVNRKLRQVLKKKNNFLPLSYIDRGSYKYIQNITMPTLKSYQLWLKSLELYITGRFHGVCMSALVGTPFLTFTSNSHKIKGILKDMDCQELLIDSLEEIETKKTRAIELAPKARKYAVEAKPKIEELFKRIGAL